MNFIINLHMKHVKICFLILLIHASLNAQQFASWKDNRLRLDNRVVNREIVIEKDKIITITSN